MRDEVVIKNSILGNVLYVLLCAVFVFLGVLMHQAEDHWGVNVWGIAFIIFFGSMGPFYFIFRAWRPLVVISSEGIEIPHWRKNTFVPWKNVDGFREYRTSSQKYVIIFLRDAQDIIGIGKASRKKSRLFIGLTFFIKAKAVIEALQEFHDRYKATHGYQWETKP